MKKISICQEGASINLEYLYSKARISSYDNLDDYYYDIMLGESFYPALRTLEIILRNSLWHSICSALDNKNWLIEGYLLLGQEKEMLLQAQEKIRLSYSQRVYDNNHLISELNFGFWNNLLNQRYEKIFWPKCIKQFVPHIPRKNRYRDFIHGRLKNIRHLRNRIFHHERISHIKNIAERHQEILEVISWIEPEVLKHLKVIDRFSLVYQSKSIKINREDNAELCQETIV